MTADRSEAATAMAAGEADRAVALLRSALARAESIRSPVYVTWCRELAPASRSTRSATVEAAARELAIASEMSDQLGAIRHRIGSTPSSGASAAPFTAERAGRTADQAASRPSPDASSKSPN